ncbi:hypothetical protein DFQ29_009849 [Apophysomyces sp. BC1021]|nr:hypothetical protein DFQ29_009849 [Apophysomyces sp. BC1021]
MVDVLINGCGPVGMFFGYLMARRGHSIYIVDKKSSPTIQSRAILVTAHVLEVLESEGIAHHLLKKSHVIGGIQMHLNGSKAGLLDVAQDTAYPQMTAIPQGTTETVLKEQLEKMTTIHWNTELISYQQEQDHITAVVRNDTEGETTIKAKYIIGADGCHSVVRKQGPDWTYEGYSVATLFAIADVALTGPDVESVLYHMTMCFGSEGICGVIPLGPLTGDSRQYFRIIINTGPYERSTPDAKNLTHGIAKEEGMTLEKIQEIMNNRMTMLDLTATDPLWISHFRINERKANGFRRNRAFLMGDASHCHSPVGGQGMNLGFLDAHNLAWKLSLVLNGQSSDPEALLDSYSSEREPHVEQTMRATGNATEIALTRGFFTDILRSSWLKLIFAIPWIKNYSAQRMMQIQLILPASPILGSSDPGLLSTGQYLPDTALLRRRVILGTESGVVSKTLRQILQQSPRHTALLVATRPPHFPRNTLTTIFWNKVLPYRATVRPIVVESAWHVFDHRVPKEIDQVEDATDGFWIEGFSDASDSVTAKVGLQAHLSSKNPPAALIIIRPDQYVAHSVLIHTSSDLDTAFKFFDTYMKKQ